MAKSSIATAYVQVVPSAQGIKGSLSKQFGGEGASAGSSFGSNLIGKVSGMLAAAGIGKMLTDTIMAGADLEQSLGGIETLFKDNAATVIQNSETAYRRAGMSANDYMETVTSFSASLLQSVGGDTEAAASIADMALVDMSDNANKMGTDIESIQNAYQGFAKQNYTMLDNLKLGYGGTKAEMQRLLADAEKLTGIKYDIKNLDDVYLAIHAIQKEMGIAGATAAEAEGTLTGSLNSIKAAFSDFMANLALGRDLEQSLSNLTDSAFTFLVGNLLPAVGRILQGLPAVLKTAFNAAIQGLNLLADNADVILQQGVDLVVGLGTAIIAALPQLADAALSVVSALGNAIISADWNPAAKETITGLKKGLDFEAVALLGEDDSITQPLLSSISTGLPALAESGVSIVTELANGLLAGLPGFLDTAGSLLISLYDAVWSAMPSLWSSGLELAMNLVRGIISNLPSIVSSAASLIANFLATFASHLPEMLEQGISLIGELIAGIASMIPDVLMCIGEVLTALVDEIMGTDWLALGSDIIDGIQRGIESAWNTLVEAFSGLWDSLFGNLNLNVNVVGGETVLTPAIPGHATGLDYVPFDNYIARLHKGEMVVPAKEAAYLRGSLRAIGATGFGANESDRRGGVTVNQYIYSEAKTAADLMEEAVYQQEKAVLLGV